MGFLGSAGYYDFAGSGIVHMVGGLCGFIGAAAAEPRLGRFVDGNEGKFRAHNVPLIVLGTLILWFGWFGFNAGSTLSMSGDNVNLAAYVSVNTMIAASSGGIVTFLLRSKFIGKGKHNYDVGAMCNGILAGLVAITAPCGNVSS
jgi:Amt family ammonium transporter